MKCEIKGYEDIEFKVGQVWFDGRGSKVTIESIMDPEAATFNIVGDNDRSYTLTGIYRFDLERTGDDLVSLCEDLTPARVKDPVADLDPFRVTKPFEPFNAILKIEEPAIEDKMADILIQLLSKRDKDLEKISLVFNTYIQLEKMR